jgi:hypothetical protein
VGQEEEEDAVQGLVAECGGPTMMAGDDNGTRVEVEGLLVSSVIDMVKGIQGLHFISG